VEVTLRVGSVGAVVRDLQRELRRRGLRVKVDGAYGPGTKRAVMRIQKRMGLATTGVADPRFLGRLGIRVRAVAAVGVIAPARTGAQYLRTFPVVGDYTYSDDYGNARSQGSHEGNDIMADAGTPVVAVADGVIKRLTRSETGLGGIWIWFLDDAGNEYYYAHLASITEGLKEGSRARVGQVIGTVGNTGDARSTAPHLHFEVHPGGGEPINPYLDLVAVDPKPRPTVG
jgi:murein DD-endopeptidase MepM/ murein hydrolase activator NlpD